MLPGSADMTAEVTRRRRLGMAAVAVLLGVDVFATGIFGGSERTLAIVRSFVLPGLPFLEWHVPMGIAAIAAALLSVGAWLRWGMDWLLLGVVTICLGLAAFVMPLHHAEESHAHHVVQASHEFTVVLVVFALVAQLRLLVARLPGGDRLRRHLAGHGALRHDPQAPAGLALVGVDQAGGSVRSAGAAAGLRRRRGPDARHHARAGARHGRDGRTRRAGPGGSRPDAATERLILLERS